MGMCFYIVNHETRQYLDYGKAVGSIFEPESGYHVGDNTRTTNAAVVGFLLSGCQHVEIINDSTGDLSFLDDYIEYYLGPDGMPVLKGPATGYAYGSIRFTLPDDHVPRHVADGEHDPKTARVLADLNLAEARLQFPGKHHEITFFDAETGKPITWPESLLGEHTPHIFGNPGEQRVQWPAGPADIKFFDTSGLEFNDLGAPPEGEKP